MTRLIVDAHSHIGRTVTNGIGQGVKDWLGGMDKAGIAQAIISVAAGGIQSEGLADTRRANDVIAHAVREHPLRFPIGLAGIEVRHGEAGLHEVKRAREELGLKGLVFHPTFEGFGVDSAVFHSLLEALGTGRSLVMIHATTDGRGNPTAIASVARRFSHLQFLIGHPVFTPQQREQCVAAVAANANILLDLAYQSDPAITEFFVGEVGADRILFGSDAPYYDPGSVVASIQAASISESDRELIFHGNAKRLIHSFA